jgi:hypothetical protein
LDPIIHGVMRRYHFHIVDGMRVFDSLGTALPDDDAARTHAQKVADDFARAFQRAMAVRVTNDLGEVVFRTPSNRSP